MERFIGLVRVSTDQQAETRLGLEAGLADIHGYVRAQGAELLQVLEEVESGGHDNMIDRPTLLKALTLCKRRRACLLIPKLDRLTRSTILAADIKRSGVSFRAVDNPTANEFTIDILVAVAAQELRSIQDRTRKALAAYKAGRKVSRRVQSLYPDGVPAEVVERTAGKLGSHLVGCHLTAEDRLRGARRSAELKRRAAAEVYADLVSVMLEWRGAGDSLRRVAERLNEEGHLTRNEKPWTAVQVMRVLGREAAVASRAFVGRTKVETMAS